MGKRKLKSVGSRFLWLKSQCSSNLLHKRTHFSFPIDYITGRYHMVKTHMFVFSWKLRCGSIRGGERQQSFRKICDPVGHQPWPAHFIFVSCQALERSVFYFCTQWWKDTIFKQETNRITLVLCSTWWAEKEGIPHTLCYPCQDFNNLKIPRCCLGNF